MNYDDSEILQSVKNTLSALHNACFHNYLTASLIETKLGHMLAISDNSYLYALEFADIALLSYRIKSLCIKAHSNIALGMTAPMQAIETELRAYFDGILKRFTTPIRFIGTTFQQDAWNTLLHVPYGQTISYAMQAKSVGKQSAYRAIANANSRNHIAIVVPCHRIIQADGSLGGYASGVAKKAWLIQHEQRFVTEAATEI